MGVAALGAVLSALEARQHTSPKRLAAFGLLAASLCVAAIYMLSMPFVHQQLTFAPVGTAWEFPALAVAVILAVGVFLMVRMTILQRVPNANEAAIRLLTQTKSWNEAKGLSAQAFSVATKEGSAISGFSVSMWLGLPKTQEVLGNAGGDAKPIRVPLFLRGVPRLWSVPDPAGGYRSVPLVKAPAIYLVLNRTGSPHLEVEFNHMEMDTTPLGPTALDDAATATTTSSETVSSTCSVQDRYTAVCKLFDRNGTELEDKALLTLGPAGSSQELHHMCVVFSEVYRANVVSNKKEFFTEVRVYVDGKSEDVAYFRGQMRQASSLITLLPPQLATSSGLPKYGDLMAGARVSDVRYYAYPVPAGRVSSLYTDGPVVEAKK
ncbi:hypothetical protein HXX76_014172 [Chlamydomonas incerta]|uniref:Uncharacterized protein n=1 Tax=Chlamydomonas incerta TaxID=51695 RepID=A0A835SMK8_CHLIN|nr:hypothetical protein HXX76_014172 [Chlamydomonas incerta]|eukprot:KAG2425014.1 hypothetical protein HXX76_014172 [Chlamydomonas incerta]